MIPASLIDSTHGLQLALGSDAHEVAASGSAWAAGVELRNELDEYVRRVIRVIGNREATARTSSRVLAAMVRSAGAGSLRRFVLQPDAVVAALRRGRREIQQDRHLAIDDYLELFHDDLSAGVEAACRSAIERAFGGRTRVRSDLVDRHFAGSTKQVRRRAPLTWLDGDRLISAASGIRRSTARRDVGLMATHLRTSLAPNEILKLGWEDLVAVLDARDELTVASGPNATGAREFAIHQDAVTTLRRLWIAAGQPPTGPVFTTARRPYRRLSPGHTASLVCHCAEASGLPHLDRRHLRWQFLWFLRQQGWSDLRLRDLFGYDRVAEVGRVLRRFEEAAAQRRSLELLVLPQHPAIPNDRTDSVPTTGGSRAVVAERKDRVHRWEGP